jgi:hypothetical protein
MIEPLAELDARLKSLVCRVMIEGDPIKYDNLCAEIWRVLAERDALKRQSESSDTAA